LTGTQPHKSTDASAKKYFILPLRVKFNDLFYLVEKIVVFRFDFFVAATRRRFESGAIKNR
jgi:hypothetical protein